jgi:hypothetical protein
MPSKRDFSAFFAISAVKVVCSSSASSLCGNDLSADANYSLFSFFNNQGPVWAGFDAGRCIETRAKVALRGDFTVSLVSLDSTKGTDHDARPAPDTALAVDDDSATLIACHRAGDAALDTGRIVAVTAAQRKRDCTFLIEDCTVKRPCLGITISLDRIAPR